METLAPEFRCKNRGISKVFSRKPYKWYRGAGSKLRWTQVSLFLSFLRGELLYEVWKFRPSYQCLRHKVSSKLWLPRAGWRITPSAELTVKSAIVSQVGINHGGKQQFWGLWSWRGKAKTSKEENRLYLCEAKVAVMLLRLRKRQKGVGIERRMPLRPSWNRKIENNPIDSSSKTI